MLNLIRRNLTALVDIPSKTFAFLRQFNISSFLLGYLNPIIIVVGIVVLCALICLAAFFSNAALIFIAGALSGGALYRYCWHSTPIETLSTEHLAYLDAQQQITETRINNATLTVESLCENTDILTRVVEVGLEESESSITKLQSVNSQLSETTTQLTTAIRLVSESNELFTESTPLLERVSNESHENGNARLQEMEKLLGVLTAQERRLTQASSDIVTTTETIEKTSLAIATSTKIIEKQQTLIEEKDEEINKLDGLLTLALEQSRFFKTALLRVTPLLRPQCSGSHYESSPN